MLGGGFSISGIDPVETTGGLLVMTSPKGSGGVLDGSKSPNISGLFVLFSLATQLSLRGVFSIANEAGLKALRKHLFLFVSLPDPSTLTTYWSCSAESSMVPVRCHLFGLFPVWFWMKHLSPILRGIRGFACSFRVSDVFVKRVRSALSLVAHASRHIGLMCGFVHFSRRFPNESESLIGRPKIICAGDRL